MKRKLRKDDPKSIWKRAHRLARTPDRFLADPLVIDFPIHYLLYALKLTGFQLENGLGFKGAL